MLRAGDELAAGLAMPEQLEAAESRALPNRRKRIARPAAPQDQQEPVLASRASSRQAARSIKPAGDEERETQQPPPQHWADLLGDGGHQEDEQQAQVDLLEARLTRHGYAARRAPLPRAASVPIRDESGRFAGVREKTAEEKTRGGGGLFKSTAVQVLRTERRLLTTGDITKLALASGLLGSTGKTPEATMASALYTDVKKKEGRSVFIRPVEGLFGLREWEPCEFDAQHRLVQWGAGGAAPAAVPARASAAAPAAPTPAPAPARRQRQRQPAPPAPLQQQQQQHPALEASEHLLGSHGSAAAARSSAARLLPTPANVGRATGATRRRPSDAASADTAAHAALAAQLATMSSPAGGLSLPACLLSPAGTLPAPLVQQLLAYQQQHLAAQRIQQQQTAAAALARAPASAPPPAKRSPAGVESSLPPKKRRRRPSGEDAGGSTGPGGRPLLPSGQENDGAAAPGSSVGQCQALLPLAHASAGAQGPGSGSGGGGSGCNGAQPHPARGVLLERLSAGASAAAAASLSDTSTHLAAHPGTAAASLVAGGATACSGDGSKCGGGASIMLLLDAIDELQRSESGALGDGGGGGGSSATSTGAGRCEEVSSPPPKWPACAPGSLRRHVSGLSLELPKLAAAPDGNGCGANLLSNGSNDPATAEHSAGGPPSGSSGGEQSVFRAPCKAPGTQLLGAGGGATPLAVPSALQAVTAATPAPNCA